MWSDLVNVDGVVSGAESQQGAVRRELAGVDWLPSPALLVDTEHLPGGGAQHDPLARHGPHHDHLAVRREAGGLGLLPHVVAPDDGPGEDVPHVEHPVVAGRDELGLGGGAGQARHVPHVTHHDLLEVELEVAGEDAVLGGSHQQLAAFPLGNGPDGAEVVWQLGLQSGLPVQSVELDDSAVLSSSGDDGAVLQHTDGEDRTVVNLPDHFGHGVVAAAPDEDVAVGVPSDDVAIGGESQTSDVLGFVSLVKDSRLPAQCERGLIKLPEVDESLPHSDDSPALQGVELSSHHGLRGALGLRDLVSPLPPGPVPD